MEFKISKELEDYRNSINFMDSHINNMISNKKEDLIDKEKESEVPKFIQKKIKSA